MRIRWIAGCLLVSMVIAGACVHRAAFEFPLQQMRLPPGGLDPKNVPQFVVFGSDDNGFPDGLRFLTEMFATQRLHYSFYVNTKYLTADATKESWLEAVQQGHEIAVHTHSHPHGREYSTGKWEAEIQQCVDSLSRIGIARGQLLGFRTPFVEYNDQVLTAVQRKKLTYDCSLEEGFRHDETAGNFVWPYRLDHGSPGNAATYKELELPQIKEHPGLWEIPPYAFVVPPDEACASYGVPPGLRSKMKQKQEYFEVNEGKITGFDWNLWFEYGMNKAEFVATLKYTLDQHLGGNRSPMTVGVHSDIYSRQSGENPPNATLQERREALREFFEYVVSKPEVRVVSARELLAWLKAPVPLEAGRADRPTGGLSPTGVFQGAGFRYSTYGVKFKDPGPAYWARVGKEMAARFPGAQPEAIWIVGRLDGRGSRLSFPVPAGDPLIQGMAEDQSEAALTLFDQLGFRVWLQVEPGFAPVEKLIHLMLKQYARHTCVQGVGVDIEWNKSLNPDGGEPVSDADATEWLKAARSYNPRYRLFLKHFEPRVMPPTVREGIVFIDDSQIFPSFDALVQEFTDWGRQFAPAPVSFQYGYPSDRPWWNKLKDPPGDIGRRILQSVPNTESLIWVDFTVEEVFPPETAPTAPERIVGVKIYEHDGDFGKLFDDFAAIGINTVFASEKLCGNAEFRQQARRRNMKVFVIEPIFYNPDALKEDPGLYAITRTGERAKEDWVEFVCPTREEYRKHRIEALRDAVMRLQPDGVSLDFIRYFVYWEMVGPDRKPETLPDTCYCPHCLARFSAETGIEISPQYRKPAQAAEWIAKNHAERWIRWKCDIITSMVQNLEAAARQAKPGILINLHAVPWRSSDYDGAIRKVAGQDFAAISQLTDFLSPMCYTSMLHRKAAWIHSVVQDMSGAASCPVLPSIQVRPDYPGDDPMSTAEFEEAVKAALEPPSRGVIFWSWEHLLQEPGKMKYLQTANLQK